MVLHYVNAHKRGNFINYTCWKASTVVINDLIIRDEINNHGHEMIALNKGWQ